MPRKNKDRRLSSNGAMSEPSSTKSPVSERSASLRSSRTYLHHVHRSRSVRRPASMSRRRASRSSSRSRRRRRSDSQSSRGRRRYRSRSSSAQRSHSRHSDYRASRSRESYRSSQRMRSAIGSVSRAFQASMLSGDEMAPQDLQGSDDQTSDVNNWVTADCSPKERINQAPVCEEKEVSDISAFNLLPRQDTTEDGNTFTNSLGREAIIEITTDDKQFNLMSLELSLTNSDKVVVRYVFKDESIPDEKSIYDKPDEVFSVPLPEDNAELKRIIIEAQPQDDKSPVRIEVTELRACIPVGTTQPTTSVPTGSTLPTTEVFTESTTLAPVCEDEEVSDISAFNLSPRQNTKKDGNTFTNSIGRKVIIEINAHLRPFNLMSLQLLLTNCDRVAVKYVFSDKRRPKEKRVYEEPDEVFRVPLPKDNAELKTIVIRARPKDHESPARIEVTELTGCIHVGTIQPTTEVSTGSTVTEVTTGSTTPAPGCEGGEVSGISAFNLSPRQNTAEDGNTFSNSFGGKVIIEINADDKPFNLMSLQLLLTNSDTVTVSYVFSDTSRPDEMRIYEEPDEVFSVPLPKDNAELKRIIIEAQPEEDNSPVRIEVTELTGCVHVEPTEITTRFTTQFSTEQTTPTTPKERCQDMTEAGSFLVSDDSVTVVGQNSDSHPTVDNFQVTYTDDVGTYFLLAIRMPANGEIESVRLSGAFIDAQIEVQQEENSFPVRVLTTAGGFKVYPDQYTEFADAKFISGDIIIQVNVEAGVSGVVTVDTFKVCTVPRNELCRIGTDEVSQALGFTPADGVVGVTEDGEVVDLDSLIYLSVGVRVIGYCYVCDCQGNDDLVCTKENCEKCPETTWSECEAGCGETGMQTIQVVGEAIGYPENCTASGTERPCVGECTTTGPPCLTSWSDWSRCEGCTQMRSRTCAEPNNPQCVDKCNQAASETRTCGNCSTTAVPTTPSSPIECQEYEVYTSCSSSHSRCQETCMAYRTGEDSCVEEEDQCEPRCECQEDYYRNTEGHCVPKETCECYPPGKNTSVPIGYTEEISKCHRCACLDMGYDCQILENCCEEGEWSEWTKCTGPCGQGTQNRTRHNSGNCNAPATEVESVGCEKICECEEDYNEVIDCEICQCIDGFIDCKPFCQEVTDCNNETHVIIPDPDQPCCKKCVEIKKPCRPVLEDSVRLDFRDAVLGTCVSSPLSIHRCEGSCDDSSMRMRYETVGRSFKLVSDMGMRSCSCCQPLFAAVEVDFVCANGNQKISLKVDTVSGCSCQACVSGG